jgi:hypothetical protein
MVDYAHLLSNLTFLLSHGADDLSKFFGRGVRGQSRGFLLTFILSFSVFSFLSGDVTGQLLLG